RESSIRSSALGFGVVMVAAAALAAVLMERRPPARSVPSSAPAPSSAGSDAGPVASPPPDASAAPAPEPSSTTGAICPAGMRHVEGLYCPFVAHRCESYLGFEPEAPFGAEDKDEQRRCAKYRDDLL